MARLLVVHDTRADVYVELTDDDEANWDGRCTCGYTASGEGARPGLNDVVEASALHVDQTHGDL